jgi:hypothetical protein
MWEGSAYTTKCGGKALEVEQKFSGGNKSEMRRDKYKIHAPSCQKYSDGYEK